MWKEFDANRIRGGSPKGRSKIGPFSVGDIANIADVANTEQIE